MVFARLAPVWALSACGTRHRLENAALSSSWHSVDADSLLAPSQSRTRGDAIVTRASDVAAALSMDWDTPSQDLAALLERAHDIEDAAWAVVDAAYPDHHHLAHEADTWQAAMLEDELAHAHESLAGLNADAGVELLMEKLDGGLQA